MKFYVGTAWPMEEVIAFWECLRHIVGTRNPYYFIYFFFFFWGGGGGGGGCNLCGGLHSMRIFLFQILYFSQVESEHPLQSKTIWLKITNDIFMSLNT